MIINYEISKIQKVLSDFNIATGITIDLLKADFTPVIQNRSSFNGYCRRIQSTEIGKTACKMSDEILLNSCCASKKTEIHFCHAGLVDVVTPIIYDDEIIGYIIFGQIKSDLDFIYIRDYLEELKLDVSLMKDFYNNLIYCDNQKIQSICDVAKMLISYILFENMLKPNMDESLQEAIKYIDENLQNSFSINLLSKSIGLSKSALYKRFHKYLGCTVSEYINRRRIEFAVNLLKNSNLSIEEISQRAGFSSISYFSRTFKKVKGTSPNKFRRKK